MKLNQHGIAHVALPLVIITAALIGYVGYRVQSLSGAATASFGTVTPGTGTGNVSVGYKSAAKFAAPSDGTMTSVSAYVDGKQTSKGTGTVLLGIYADSNGSPTALLATSAAVTVKAGQAASWVSSSLKQSVAMKSGTSYWLAIVGSTGTNVARVYTGTPTSGAVWNANASSTFTQQFGSTNSAGSFALKATYTPVTVVVANTYYVDCTTGSDTNAGTTAASAWQSLSKVSSTTFTPGASILLKRGCTWDGGVSLNGAGTATAQVVLDAYGTGNAPVVANSTGSTFTYAITLNSPYQTVKNLLIKNGSASGVELMAAHQTVSDNEITASGSGAETTSSATNALIKHNMVHDLKMVINTVSPTNDDYGAVAFNIGSNDVEIANNTCSNCKASSYDYGTDGGFVEIYNNGDNAYIHDNWAGNTDGFIEVGGNTSGTHAYNIVVSYNMLYMTGSALNLHAADSFGIPASLKFENNTVYDTSTSGVVFVAPTAEFTAQNNIFYTGHTLYSVPSVHTNNLYNMLSGVSVGFPLDSTEKIGDPQFTSISAYDFHLLSTSPARGMGVNLGLTNDFDGATVPSIPDVGAFQYH